MRIGVPGEGLAKNEEDSAEISWLFRLNEAVNRAETIGEICKIALDVAKGALHVDRAAILLSDSENVMRLQTSRGLSEACRDALDRHSPWPSNEAAPHAVVVPHAGEFVGYFPVIHRQRLLGELVVYSEHLRTFSDHELDLASTIAAQISQAIARARVLETERIARRIAERNAEHLQRLQQVTARLSEAATTAQVAGVVVTQGMAASGASTGGLWLLAKDGQSAELVHQVGYSKSGRKGFARISLTKSMNMPVLDALRSAKPIWIQSRDEFARLYPELAAMVVSRPEYGIAALPIRTGSKTCIGVLAFTFDLVNRLDGPLREFLESTARQGGLALERAQLFEVERNARALAEAAHRRASFKAEASAVLASSLDYETTLTNVATLAVPKFADWCAVELGTSPEQTHLVAVSHVDPAKVKLAWELMARFPTDPNALQGVPHVIRTGKAELIEEISDEMLRKNTRSPEHFALVQSLGFKSAIVAPIALHGRTEGAIMFIWAESKKRYGPEDLETAVLLGQRAALAIDNSKLHRDLQHAVLARDDLLAVVSHDLRNPLGAISLKADWILQNLHEDPAPTEIRKHANGIRVAAKRMEQLIHDLLDLGRIEAGQMKIAPTAHSIGALLASSVEELQALATAKGIRLHVELQNQHLSVLCDGQRIGQVLSNIIGNAIKFTSEGGSISVRSRSEARMALIMVRDTGMGIPVCDLEHIFDRHYQSSHTETNGVGLGLFIAKGIIEAHGGCIWAESTVGLGTQFSFTLPLATDESP